MGKITKVFLVSLLLINYCHSQNTSNVWDQYDKIDSIGISEELNQFVILIYSTKLDTVSNPWADIAIKLCLHELQQINAIPFKSDRIIHLVFLNISKQDSVIYQITIPQLNPMNLGISSTYFDLLRSTIDLFQPNELNKFEKTVNDSILMFEEFKFQTFLLELSRVDIDSTNASLKIDIFTKHFKDNSISGFEIARFLIERFNQIKQAEWLEMEE